MKKLIPLLFVLLCIASCGEKTQESGLTPEPLRAAVLGAESSVSAENALCLLKTSSVATLETDRASFDADFSSYDILYIDKSVISEPSFSAAAVEEFVKNGGSVFLDNETYSVFNKAFIGAEDFVTIDGCPVNMRYPENTDKSITKIQGLIWDFCDLYKNYSNYSDTLAYQSYGVGIIPSTAVCLTTYDGVGVYTLNSYGDGLVFFTNPILPNNFSVNNLSPENTGEPLAASTIGANKLLRDYFAELVSIKKYGYAVENIYGSFARPAAAWELQLGEIQSVTGSAAAEPEEKCERYGQIASFNMVRNMYYPNYRGESVTYALSKNGKYSMDAYENAYSSGTHFVSAGKWLMLDFDNSSDGYNSGAEYDKRAYPCVTDFNGDGKPDIICGSADGGIYFFGGRGMGENYELDRESMFTDKNGNPIGTGGFSSPCVCDADGDGKEEIVTGTAGGAIKVYKSLGHLMLEDSGVLLETGMTGVMPSIGDLNGDGLVDIAVGSQTGELRVYFGKTGADGTEYDGYTSYDAATGWCAPCIYDLNGDGQPELYAGTAEGYIAVIDGGGVSGYLEGDECNDAGNTHLKFGNNCVPRFYDLNGDGETDIIAGAYEYGMAVPVDSKYFPYRAKLTEMINHFKENGIYIGAAMLTYSHADPFHHERELKYHKKAFDSYGLEWCGVSQLYGYTSIVGYDTHYDNTRGYDGTYSEEYKSGLLWNSGSVTPDSLAQIGNGAEYSMLVPFYLKNGMLMLQPSNTPNGNGAYTYVAAKYQTPLLFMDSCGDMDDEKIKKADRIVSNYGYNFVSENQLAKMSAAALNNHVTVSRGGDRLYFSPSVRDTSLPLYDERYQKAAGVKIILADNQAADSFYIDANVYYKNDNCIYMSLDRNASLSHAGSDKNIKITSVNLPADITRGAEEAAVAFKEGGLMTVTVEGSVKTISDGWDVIKQNGVTTFRKYGKAATLKIIR